MRKTPRSGLFRVTRSKISRTSRTDDILLLKQQYDGELDTPGKYNIAFANVLRAMADRIETIKDAYVDPELVVWMQSPGKIQAELMLSPKE